MTDTLSRWKDSGIAVLQRRPWLAALPWALFLLVTLARVHPRRLASTFTYYMEAAQRFVESQQVYDHTTSGFLYLPSALMVLAPMTKMNLTLAGFITLFVYAAVFTYGCVALLCNLLPRKAFGLGCLASAGFLLLINIPAAWYNFKGVQSQLIMTGGMLAAAAMMMQARWLWASFWLFVAVLFKPLAIVMVLLVVVLVAPMRLPLAVAIAVILLLPFPFWNSAYLLEQYKDYFIKMSAISSSAPEEWIYRADLMTLVYAATGVSVPAKVSLAMRAVAAAFTLVLAWRVRVTGGNRAFALAVVLLSACYITLFSPRNEFLSFVVLTPQITALAFVLLARNDRDVRGWLLIAAAFVFGFWWSLWIDSWLKPAIDVAIYLWLAWQMIEPHRWNALFGEAKA